MTSKNGNLNRNSEVDLTLNKMKSGTIVIHLWWVIGVLTLSVCFIVGLFLKSEMAWTVLSGIATAISVVLSIVAIIFTLITSYASSQQSESIRQAVSEGFANFERKNEEMNKLLIKTYSDLAYAYRENDFEKIGEVISNTNKILVKSEMANIPSLKDILTRDDDD